MAEPWADSTSLGAFLPRLWQDDLQRLRSVSETRVKRLEALEKALSVTATAKAGPGIDVTIHDLQHELQQVVHEFAGSAVLSRDELEKWIRQPLLTRLHTRPNFTEPIESAKNYKFNLIMSRISYFMFFSYFPLIILINKLYPEFIRKIIEYTAHIYSISRDSSTFILFMLVPVYFIVLPLIGVIGQYRIAKRALRKLREMPESGVGEKKDSLGSSQT